MDPYGVLNNQICEIFETFNGLKQNIIVQLKQWKNMNHTTGFFLHYWSWLATNCSKTSWVVLEIYLRGLEWFLKVKTADIHVSELIIGMGGIKTFNTGKVVTPETLEDAGEQFCRFESELYSAMEKNFSNKKAIVAQRYAGVHKQ